MWNVSESDRKYYDRINRREAQRDEFIAKAKVRGEASVEWHKKHPEGITQDNLSNFQKYVREYKQKNLTSKSSAGEKKPR